MSTTIKERLRKTPNKLSEDLTLRRKEVKCTQMSINTLRAIAAQLGEVHELEEELEHSLLQQYQDGTDLEDIKMQEKTGDRVIGNNGQLKRTKSVSTSDNSLYQGDTEQMDHKRRKIEQLDSLEM
ncbi:14853_t:CDS:2 [Acaulospora morrowiae]|uniref:14853_t:CDS:1 n=1 Tax=Acaulospora morrowiae TaxID=94023 RepID=A0A9N9G588_9GLOM|nr:14853_t:CDS:2 [Acaulospora morrowiae]